MRRLVNGLGVVCTAGMFLVITMGALVTNTGSGDGCGTDWPLCHGQFIPAFALATLIEWSHRAVTGAEGLLVAAFCAGCLALYRRHREMQVLVPAMAFFILLQAGLGALAVKYPQSDLVMAAHFGISSVSLLTVLLATAFTLERGGADALRDVPVAATTRRFIWGALGWLYAVIYIGAYMRHSGASLACSDVPFCNGTGFGDLTLAPVAIHLGHRAAAGLLSVLVVTLWLRTRHDRAARPDLYRGATVALVATVAQASAGVLVVLTRLDLFTTLAHAFFASVLFAALGYCAYRTLPRHVPAPRGGRNVTSTLKEAGADLPAYVTPPVFTQAAEREASVARAATSER